ncbi:hypothetical protein CFC21_012337, partial [Triticum aestivum]
MQALTVKVYQ